MNNYIKDKRLFIWDVKDIWFQVDRFKECSDSPIVILHTYKKLDEKFFDIKKSGETILIDLNASLEDILKKMEKRGRWSVKKAMREGVYVKKIEAKNEIDGIHHFFIDFCKDKKISASTKKEFFLLDVFAAQNKTTEQFLGFCAFLKSPNKGFYIYKHGAVIHKGQENEAIIWKAIQYAKEEGYKIFDMGGIVSNPEHSSFHQGRFRFKKTFGGEIVGFYIYVKFNNRFLKILSIPFKFFVKDLFDKDLITLLDKLKIRKLMATTWNELTS